MKICIAFFINFNYLYIIILRFKETLISLKTQPKQSARANTIIIPTPHHYSTKFPT